MITATAKVKKMMVVGLVLAAVADTGWVRGADIGRRTSIVCSPDSAKSFVLRGDDDREEAGSSERAGRVRTRFGHWLFSREKATPVTEIRFVWVPEAPGGPTLKVQTDHAHHMLVDVRSHGRDSVVAVSSASDPFSVVGWLFAINFAHERILASSVRSNPGGVQSQAVNLSCNFHGGVPRVDPPQPGSGIG